MGDFVTTSDAAKILGRSKSWVDQKCRAGQIPYQVLGQTRMIRRQDLRKFEGKPKQSPGPKPGGKRKNSAKKGG